MSNMRHRRIGDGTGAISKRIQDPVKPEQEKEMDKMDKRDNDFRALVRRMREAQREYFKTRNSGWLRLSKDLERQVDEVLKGDTAADAGDLFRGGV